MEAELVINDKKLNQIDANQDTKTLGVQMGLSLQWITQFKMIEEKLQMAMWKLKSTPVTVSNTYMFYNIYLLTHVYYGCEIVKFTPKQEQRLMKICEPVLLKKLGLSDKFPREMLYARKLALGVGLMKPSIIVYILAFQWQTL